MQIDPNHPAAKAPAERFAGDVSVDPIAWPRTPEQRAVLARIRFAPGPVPLGTLTLSARPCM